MNLETQIRCGNSQGRSWIARADQMKLVFLCCILVSIVSGSSVGEISLGSLGDIAVASRVSGSPYPVSQIPKSLFAIDYSQLSASQIVAAETLQGILAQVFFESS